MRRSLTNLHAMASIGVVLLLLVSVRSTRAQNRQVGYRPPNFNTLSQQEPPAYQPRLPASPLAGGLTAARGDAFMDAHGKAIVMPASYYQDSQGGGYSQEYQGGGYGAACPSCSGGGYGDASLGASMMGGGNCYGGPDQSGPHYFDVSVAAVFLRGEELFDGAPSFASVGVGLNAPRVLNPGDEGDYEPGWKIAVRYDLGPLSLFEATYMGLYDISASGQARSLDETNPPANFQLFSPFSNYGTGTLIPGVDDAAVVQLGYKSDLQSTELSYRRYWVDRSPRITGTFLLGFRYLRLTEDFTYNTFALAGDSSRLWSSENDMLGAQVGGDGWFTLRQGLRLGSEIKVGLYNNHYVFTNAGNLPDVADNFRSTVKGDQVAFAAEGSVSLVIDILPSWSLRGDYQVLYMNSLALAGGNVDAANYFSTATQTQSDALYHGFNAGLEYIW